MKRIIICIVLILINSLAFAQNLEDVTLVTTGTATTEQEAILVALRSAIEQTYGSFVSANTTLLDDEIVKDEIVSVSKGNIKKYSKIASTVLSNGLIMVTVKSVVSLSKLIQYARSKGSKAEFAGDVFGQNLKLMKLKSENTRKAYENMCTQVLAMLDNAFDYTIELKEPKAVGIYEVSSQYYDTPKYICDGFKLDAVVKVLANEVNFAIYRLVNSTLKAISISDIEYKEYKKFGIDCCCIAGSQSAALTGYKPFLKLADDRFEVRLPMSLETVEKLDLPVIIKMEKGFFNYVIHDMSNNMDYTWRARRKKDRIMGYNITGGDNIRNKYNIIDNGLGLFSSNNTAFNGYRYGRYGLGVSTGDYYDRGHHYEDLIQSLGTIVSFGCLMFDIQLNDYDNKGATYAWEEWESLSSSQGNEIIDIDKVTLKNTAKKKSKKQKAKVLLSYKLSFFFTEDEISRFTGLEIVPHR